MPLMETITILANFPRRRVKLVSKLAAIAVTAAFSSVSFVAPANAAGTSVSTMAVLAAPSDMIVTLADAQDRSGRRGGGDRKADRSNNRRDDRGARRSNSARDDARQRNRESRRADRPRNQERRNAQNREQRRDARNNNERRRNAQNDGQNRRKAQQNDRRERRAQGADQRRETRRAERREDRRDARREARREDRQADRRDRREAYRDGRRDQRQIDRGKRREAYRDGRRDQRRYYRDRRNDRYAHDRRYRRADGRRYRSGHYKHPRVRYGGRYYGHGHGPRRGHGYWCSSHSIFHYYKGYDPFGWAYASFGWNLYSSAYVRDCDVVSQTFYRRGRRYEEVALLCYDSWGYGYIKPGSRRVYRDY